MSIVKGSNHNPLAIDLLEEGGVLGAMDKPTREAVKAMEERVANWKAFFIGIRPLWRVLSGQTTWRSMARSMFCWRFYIVEVKK